uniref:Uncharacterized protein n=1 Tax=Anguilla anguilla TaxID=7936 RepID=A0A0E9PUN0_ANGAN
MCVRVRVCVCVCASRLLPTQVIMSPTASSSRSTEGLGSASAQHRSDT